MNQSMDQTFKMTCKFPFSKPEARPYSYSFRLTHIFNCDCVEKNFSQTLIIVFYVKLNLSESQYSFDV